MLRASKVSEVVLLIAVFSILKSDTFLTAFTFQSMVNSRSINALIALAVMIPLASNNFDLSVASTLGISQVLANGLQTQEGLPWQLACLLCVVLGAAVGLVNGLLVTRARINSFIATLGFVENEPDHFTLERDSQACSTATI